MAIEQTAPVKDVMDKLLAAQQGEMTEYFIYKRLARSSANAHNRDILQRIARDELEHHNAWKRYTKRVARPRRSRIWLYYLISRIFGLTFGIKLMEHGEQRAQRIYREIAGAIPEAAAIATDEDDHEQALVNMIDEERLHYTADVMRGLNVAVVELTGLLAGLTLAVPETQLIILTGLVAGSAMVLSVASTEYLAARSGEGTHSPFKALLYGAMANVITVLLLIFPYFVFSNVYYSLGLMIFNAVVVIFLFSYYISVARELRFRRRFVEMVVVSLGVAGMAFVIGFLARTILHIEV